MVHLTISGPILKLGMEEAIGYSVVSWNNSGEERQEWVWAGWEWLLCPCNCEVVCMSFYFILFYNKVQRCWLLHGYHFLGVRFFLNWIHHCQGEEEGYLYTIKYGYLWELNEMVDSFQCDDNECWDVCCGKINDHHVVLFSVIDDECSRHVVGGSAVFRTS